MSWNIEEALSYYKKQGAPSDQTALISLLREIQAESGGSIQRPALSAAAAAYGVKESFLLAVIKRIPSLRFEDSHCLEICSGPNCGKHRDLASLAQQLHTASGGKFTLRFVQCMRMCGKGPNIAELVRGLIESAK